MVLPHETMPGNLQHALWSLDEISRRVAKKERGKWIHPRPAGNTTVDERTQSPASKTSGADKERLHGYTKILPFCKKNGNQTLSHQHLEEQKPGQDSAWIRPILIFAVAGRRRSSTSAQTNNGEHQSTHSEVTPQTRPAREDRLLAKLLLKWGLVLSF